MLAVGKVFGRGYGVGRPLRLGLLGESDLQPAGGNLFSVILADRLLLGANHQAGPAITGVGRGREHVVEKRPADGNQGLNPGVGNGGLSAVDPRRRVVAAHASAKSPGQNNDFVHLRFHHGRYYCPTECGCQEVGVITTDRIHDRANNIIFGNYGTIGSIVKL